jgi:lactose/L-arabinose transport system ATP-binding protein
MASLKISKATKKYDDLEVIHGIDLDIQDGEFCVFVGPSGCGKSTLLRMISGLEEVTSGQIHIGDTDVTTLHPADRGIAMVFQSYALYPHMTVRENMGFGLKMSKVPSNEIEKKVNEAAEILHLEEYLDRKPKTLSGGQRQRVAIGRSIVRGPEVFLFDEPLSNLDAELRVEMRVEISRLHRELGTTIIYVTHDQVEAMTLADKIVVLKDGLIQQVGTPLSLYDDPENVFVAGFIGSPTINFVRGDINGSKLSIPSLKSIKLEIDKSVASSYSEILIGLGLNT